jgi:N-acetylgalactosamine-N,N'-diacetylbacillosaminyl-diphospho-undecaprenol 4-alpha-N-acetylgalactosaminyltransferase
MTRSRIIFLINSLTGGGAERVMCTLLRHSEAERSAFDMTLALLDDEPAAYAPPDWLEVRQLDGRKSALHSGLSVRRLFKEIQPDVTLSFLTRANVANVVNARCPCIISERANTAAHFGSGIAARAARELVRTTYPRADRIIAVSEGVAHGLSADFGIAAEKIVAIPNPIDLAMIEARAGEALGVNVDGRYILAAGRLVKSKNFEMLIRAFAAAEPGWKLVIVGEGPDREALMALAAELGVGERVLLPGFVANPYPLMRDAELFVLSSNAEGFPNALVEAMALGVPVIAANCASGPSEILAECAQEDIGALTMAAHGLLTPPNDVAAMSEALRAMADPALRKSYGAKAAARAAAFGAVPMKDRYWDVIRSVMAS